MEYKHMKKRILAFTLAAMMCAASLTACSNKSSSQDNSTNAPVEETIQKDVALDEIVTAVKDAYGENYGAAMPLDEQMLTDLLGINMDEVEEFFAEFPMMSAHIDTFIVLKAKEGNIDSVYEQLNLYRENQMNDTMCYPSNALRIQGSQIMKVGNYAIYMMLGEHADIEAAEEDAVKFAQEQGQIGVDAINALFA